MTRQMDDAGGIMEFRHIFGESHFLQAPTNIGVHIVDNESVVIDTGFGRDNARKLLKILDEIISIIDTQLGVESNVFQYLLSSTTLKGHLTNLMRRGLITMKLDKFKIVWHKV